MSSERADNRSRFIKIDSVDGKTLFFIANSVAESVVLFCGLKLLIERETARVGIRGGKHIDGSNFSSPKTSNSRNSPPFSLKEEGEVEDAQNTIPNKSIRHETLAPAIFEEKTYSSPTLTEDFLVSDDNSNTHSANSTNSEKYSQPSPESNSLNSFYSHSSVSSYDNTGDCDDPQNVTSSLRYVQGKSLQSEIASNIAVPVPLPLCKALLLDATSPLAKKWEVDRGHLNYQYGEWNFKNISPRSTFDIDSFESALIGGKMAGGFRNVTFESMKNGQKINLHETWIVDIDEPDKFMFTITERMPSRGFSVKVGIVIRPSTINSCEVSMVGEFMPLSKNTSDQAKVHRAFVLLLSEVKGKYGQGGRGKRLMKEFDSSNDP